MPEDASLDDFLGSSGKSDGDDSAEAGPEPGGDTADAADAEPDSTPAPEPVDPVAATYDWSPDGAPCGVCGDVVRARWRDDGHLVCVDCKEW